MRKVLSKGKAAGVLRLVFHDAGTFDVDDNTGIYLSEGLKVAVIFHTLSGFLAKVNGILLYICVKRADIIRVKNYFRFLIVRIRGANGIVWNL